MFFQELLAAGKAAATVRSYGMDLLRWWRFLHAVQVPWDRATRVDARDFSCWIQLTVKPRATAARRPAGSVGAPNPVTGKTTPGSGYAPSTVAAVRRCCAGSLTCTVMPDPGRCSTRSRWIWGVAPAARTRTTTRWTPGRQSGQAATGRRSGRAGTYNGRRSEGRGLGR
ncbi:site-specific integrase [Streptomyces sp. NPDC055692]|uniref:site-specific integrase n=1 Tax=Streptomyces sp. NPDC055692 TaxID=3155683 RepID=UPI003441700E